MVVELEVFVEVDRVVYPMVQEPATIQVFDFDKDTVSFVIYVNGKNPKEGTFRVS